jgi:hypothetical protein
MGFEMASLCMAFRLAGVIGLEIDFRMSSPEIPAEEKIKSIVE